MVEPPSNISSKPPPAAPTGAAEPVATTSTPDQQESSPATPQAPRSEVPKLEQHQVGLRWTYVPVADAEIPQSVPGGMVLRMADLLMPDGSIPISHEENVTNPFKTVDASEREKKHDYIGYRISDLLQSIPNAEDFKAIRFIGSDGFPAIIYLDENDKNNGRDGLIALADTTASDASDGSANFDNLPPRPDGSDRGMPDPAMVIFADDHPLHLDTYKWPYKIETIQLIPK